MLKPLGGLLDRMSYWHVFLRMWVLWIKGDTRTLDKYLYAMMSRSFEHNDMFVQPSTESQGSKEE